MLCVGSWSRAGVEVPRVLASHGEAQPFGTRSYRLAAAASAALSSANPCVSWTHSIAYVLYVIAFVCTYLLWLFAWLHQWHPLIKPEWKDE
mmetsp:Transcript_1041/g.2873  ORF Transcript_1041/g.2873 Transcript_1041/m.2873 type:complete len:91 (-) Transcript_1041:83-355(-)